MITGIFNLVSQTSRRPQRGTYIQECFYTTSSPTEKKVSSLRNMLKKFYRLVHPDYFGNYKKEKEVNLQSFQKLRAYLEEFQEKGEEMTSKSTKYKEYDLAFYLKPPKDSEEKEAKGPNKELKLVKVVLRAPPTDISPKWRDSYLTKSIGELFQSCGLTEEFSVSGFATGEDKREFKERMASSENPSLVGILQGISNESRLRSRTRYEEERRVEMAQTMIYIETKMRIVWQLPSVSPDSTQFLKVKLFLLERLQEAFIILKDKEIDMKNLMNATVIITNHTNIDPMGRITLDSKDSAKDWTEILRNYSPDNTNKIKDAGKDRNLKEKEIAKKIGLAYFYSDFQIASTVEYLNFLEKINESNITPFQGLENLKIRVLGSDSVGIKDFSSDFRSCTLNIPISSTIEELVEAISIQGYTAVRQYDQFLRESEELADLILKVKLRFRVKSLTTDPTVKNRDLCECLKRLLRNAFGLKQYLDSTKLNITTFYSLNEDGVINIRWDFAL